MKMKPKLNNRGFTLIELLIATVIFSIILLATTTIVLQIGKMYYKGVVVNRTQETTRRITDEISQQLQFGADTFVPVQTEFFGTTPSSLMVRSFCIGNQRYSYAPNAKVNNSAQPGQYNTNGHALRHGLWRDTVVAGSDCAPLDLSQVSPSDGDTVGGGQELLGENMRVTHEFNVTCPGGSSLCNVKVGVLYGDDDLVIAWPNPTNCGNVVGSQWCAASTISAQVFKRLQQAGA